MTFIDSNVKKLAGYFMDVLEEKQEKVMENLQVNDSKSLPFFLVKAFPQEFNLIW